MRFNWGAFRYSDGLFREFGMILTGLVLIVGVWSFVELSGSITADQTRTFDEYILSSLRTGNELSQPVGPAWMPEIARDITALGSKIVLTLIVSLVAGFLFLKKNKRHALLIIAASAIGVLITSVLKYAFMRDRPDIISHLTIELNPSYPSGHTLMSAVIYLSLAAMLSYYQSSRIIKIYSMSAAILLALAVGASRVYLGVHYPTDVLAGWALGFAWAAFCWIVFRYINHHFIKEKKYYEH